MNASAAAWNILWPALAAGVLVSSTHVPLGMQVLSRGIVFIDLAIAQIAGLGSVLKRTDWPCRRVHCPPHLPAHCC